MSDIFLYENQRMVLGVNWTSITYCRMLEEVAWGANNAPIINQYHKKYPNQESSRRLYKDPKLSFHL